MSLTLHNRRAQGMWRCKRCGDRKPHAMFSCRGAWCADCKEIAKDQEYGTVIASRFTHVSFAAPVRQWLRSA